MMPGLGTLAKPLAKSSICDCPAFAPQRRGMELPSPALKDVGLKGAKGLLDGVAVVGEAEEGAAADDDDGHDEDAVALKHLVADARVADVELAIGELAGVEEQLEGTRVRRVGQRVDGDRSQGRPSSSAIS